MSCSLKNVSKGLLKTHPYCEILLSVSFLSLYAKSLQLCLTLCDPMGYSPPDFSILGILQAKILEWVAMPFSRGSSVFK